ncbi:hypothetical protein [Mycolicibacterium mageritense]|uniref:hypothetical protein n=1 Tax=Mycolicibacterium mageritense TaxID=53462 RepID=UPI0011519381|nr:hypothetical protein [Mycolicibacterium mageritense]TXI56238.1 MAG: hypothetical protein E6Q55_29590 [Mycolicibacterium mageritense]
MRLRSGDLAFGVTITGTSPRWPIRLRLGPLVYGLSPDEAIELATQLADVVQAFREQENS